MLCILHSQAQHRWDLLAEIRQDLEFDFNGKSCARTVTAAFILGYLINRADRIDDSPCARARTTI